MATATMAESSTRPYLLRAMHEWMSDNALTPHIVVDATVDGVMVPEEHIADGKIVLNVSLSATRALVLGNEEVNFEARFAGAARQLYIPIDAVLGIYARETGQGMVFAEAGPDSPDPGPGTAAGDDSGTGPDKGAGSKPPRKPGGGSRPTLKVVK